MKRNIVVFINAPNTHDILHAEKSKVTSGIQHSDWANLPCLGILSLASYLKYNTDFETVYIDGVVCPWDFIKEYLKNNSQNIFAVCISALTASYGATLKLFSYVKKDIDKNIITIIGNDHFSAMPKNILTNNADIIDYGFIGNEVQRSLKNLLVDLKNKKDVDYNNYPGMVYKRDDIIFIDEKAEPINTLIDYSLIDKTFPHSNYYNSNFQRRLKSRLYEKFNQDVLSGIPIELARGCIKFAQNDACSFCSIQREGMWRNALSAKDAWKVLENAYKANYGYFYITADELALTFKKLIKDMLLSVPSWWKNIPSNKKPIIMGYVRADGLNQESASILKKLGFRILMIGLDAGTPISLAAMNKPLLSTENRIIVGKKLFEQNIQALKNAEKNNLLIKAGFVIGHIGADKEILQKNIDSICLLLKKGKKAILSVDVEVLSPEPGSKDYNYLINPDFALKTANNLNLKIADHEIREKIAKKYIGKDIFEREVAMADYISSVMPDLTFKDLAKARDQVRDYAKSLGLLIGE